MNEQFFDQNSLLGLISSPVGIGYLAAGLVFVTGLYFFLFPRLAMGHLRLEGVVAHQEAFGEARSSFAGFLIASGGLVWATQAGELQFSLALSLAIAAVGKFSHILLDGARQWSVYIRLAIVALLAGFLSPSAMLIPVAPSFPQELSTILPAITGVVTVLFGLICFFAPLRALSLMRLRPADAFPAAKGEVRGMLGGFYLSAGLTVLLVGGFHASLLIGCAWLVTAFGRMISMLSDGANNSFNWISLILELALAMLPLSVVLGLLG